MNTFIRATSLGVAISIALLSAASEPLLVAAQSTPRVVARTSPGKLGGTRVPGTKRWSCRRPDPPLTVLVPEMVERNTSSSIDETIKVVEGQTMVTQPTVWFYVPYTRSDSAADVEEKRSAIEGLEFILQEMDGPNPKKVIYSVPVELPNVPGVMSVQIPSSVSLELNRPYRWLLQVTCINPEDRRSFVSAVGWIERIAANPEVMQQLKTNPEHAAVLYGQSGAWYDVLTALANERRKKPQDAKLLEAWKALLKEIGLEGLAEQAIAP